jgi:biopolymer transport protein ExbD
MPWQLRHEGSPQQINDLTLQQIAEGLRDGLWEPTDEVMGPGEPSWQAIENHPQLEEIAEEIEAPPLLKHDEGTNLDFNALIDVCLVLLIFFILTTTYATAVQKVVPLPTLKSEGKKTRLVSVKEVKDRMIRLQASVDAAGKPALRLENQPVQVLAADGQTIDPAKLRDALKPYVSGADRKTEIILDARDISWGTVIAIQDAAKAAGVHTVHHLLKREAAK